MTEGLVLLRHRADLTISLFRGHGRQQAGPHGTFARRRRASWWDSYEPASVTSQAPVWRSECPVGVRDGFSVP